MTISPQCNVTPICTIATLPVKQAPSQSHIEYELGHYDHTNTNNHTDGRATKKHNTTLRVVDCTECRIQYNDVRATNFSSPHQKRAVQVFEQHTES
mmetsp:Transcript_47401/g.53812  ORF Transcript_47401/g.53812 Transcript_47401/m.53812 type:complete len:96 (-) Transcript_47401:112-399(-)